MKLNTIYRTSPFIENIYGKVRLYFYFYKIKSLKRKRNAYFYTHLSLILMRKIHNVEVRVL